MKSLHRVVNETIDELIKAFESFLKTGREPAYKTLYARFRQLLIKERWASHDDCIDLLERILNEKLKVDPLVSEAILKNFKAETTKIMVARSKETKMEASQT